MTRIFRILLLACIAMPLPVLGQQSPVSDEYEYWNFHFHTVKRDKIGKWEELMLERRAAAKASGRPFRYVFQRVRGVEGSFLILHLDSRITEARLPRVEIAPDWSDRIRPTVQSSAMITLAVFHRLTTRQGRWEPGESGFLHLRTTTVEPGSRQAYFEWQREELVPLLRDKGYSLTTGQVYVGGDTRTWMTLTAIPAWGHLRSPDWPFNPLSPHLVVRAGEGLGRSHGDDVYRFRPDLSFVND